MSFDILDRVYGCLIAGAIGDAMGAPAEDWHYSFARDADSIATVLGGLAGALAGASAIPAYWIADSEAANRAFFAEVVPGNPADFRATAAALAGTLRQVRRGLDARAAVLDAILAGRPGEERRR